MSKPGEIKSDIHQLVVVGSGGVGKSCLTVRFLKDEYSTEYDPTIEENYRKHITVDSLPSIVNIIDTAGQHEYTALRDQHLKDGKGFLLVFAMNDRGYFKLKEQIVKLKDTKRVPFTICGNKCDLPEAMFEVGRAEATEWCALNKLPYLETSAKNVTESFHELVKECRKIDAGKTGKKKGGSKGGCRCVLQ